MRQASLSGAERAVHDDVSNLALASSALPARCGCTPPRPNRRICASVLPFLEAEALESGARPASITLPCEPSGGAKRGKLAGGLAEWRAASMVGQAIATEADSR